MGFGVGEALTAAAIGAQVYNTSSQAKSNRKSRKFAREENEKARQFALDDWNRTNAYNSPAAQMQRYKEAGLNPNLIYGQTNTADAVSSYKANPYQEQAPTFDSSPLVQGASLYYDNQIKRQTVENAAAQKALIEAQTKAALSQAAAAIQNALTGEFDLGLKKDLRATSIDAAAASLQKLYADIGQTNASTTFTLDENARKQALHATNVEQAIQNILATKTGVELTRSQIAKLKVEINNLKTQGLISEKHLEMWRQGINPNAGGFERLMQFIYEKLFGAGNQLTPTEKRALDQSKPLRNPTTSGKSLFYK